MRRSVVAALLIVVGCGGQGDEPRADAPLLPVDARLDAPLPDGARFDGPSPPDGARLDAPSPLPDGASPDAPSLPPVTLTVTKSGDGSGTVTGNGLSCGGTCSVTLPRGTAVTLAATADSLDSNASTFTTWGGGCTGSGACTFPITGDTTVDASFKLKPNLMFTTSALYDGDLGGLAGADAKCQALAAARGLGGRYIAYLGGTGVDAPSRFAGASGWTRVDGLPMIDAIGEFGTVTLPSAPVLDEGGGDLTVTAQVRVWTATSADTTYWGQNCNSTGAAADWSTTSGRTTSGVCTTTDGGVLVGGSVSPCATPLRLYCFGIDRAATIAPGP